MPTTTTPTADGPRTTTGPRIVPALVLLGGTLLVAALPGMGPGLPDGLAGAAATRFLLGDDFLIAHLVLGVLMLGHAIGIGARARRSVVAWSAAGALGIALGAGSADLWAAQPTWALPTMTAAWVVALLGTLGLLVLAFRRARTATA